MKAAQLANAIWNPLAVAYKASVRDLDIVGDFDDLLERNAAQYCWKAIPLPADVSQNQVGANCLTIGDPMKTPEATRKVPP
jgi:hypothetical protein